MFGGHEPSIGTSLWHVRQARESINKAWRDFQRTSSGSGEERDDINSALIDTKLQLQHVIGLLKDPKGKCVARGPADDDEKSMPAKATTDTPIPLGTPPWHLNGKRPLDRPNFAAGTREVL
jgi:hypothetical protein